MKLKNIVKGIEGCEIRGSADAEVLGVVCDSSLVKEGWCFAALCGEKRDGCDFIPDAVRRGASAIVSERQIHLPQNAVNVVVKNPRRVFALISANFFGEPSKHMSLVGVTGTNGKTTVTYLLEAIFKASGKNPGVIGTISHRFRNEARPAFHTTPESCDLQKLLADMREKGTDICFMEVSSHALSQERAAGCHFDAAVFTNLTSEHLDYHGEMEAYFESKAILFERLLGESAKKNPFAVINIDDSYGKALVEKCQTAVVTYGFHPSAAVRAVEVSLDGAAGLRLKFRAGEEIVECGTKLCGRFNAQNILAASAVALNMGIAARVVKDAVQNMKAVPGRFEVVPNRLGVTAIVDYAHTPDAILNVLSEARVFAEKNGGRLIAVFGCGGDRDRKKRPMMGRTAAKLADKIIVTSDNPRSENPDAIIDEIMMGVREVLGRNFDRTRCEVIEDRRSAIECAVKTARKGDTVVVAGKGHEDYQIIGEKRLHFDDREVLKEFLE